MENLGREVDNLNGDLEDSIINPNKKNSEIEKDAKMKKDNTLMKQEDLDGLQMLRLIQEDKISFKKDIMSESEELIDQQILFENSAIISSTESDEFNHEINFFQIAKSIIKMPSHISQNNSTIADPKPTKEDNDIKSNSQIKKTKKYKGVEGLCIERKPALVKKKVSDFYGLTERQQKILQDFHVKFVLEGVEVEEDDEVKASRHLEFIELKKQLEEEEKIYAGCALGEASDVDHIEVNPSTIIPKKLTTMHVPVEDLNSSKPIHIAVKATTDEVINSFAEVAICRQNSNPQEDMQPLPQPQNVRYAMKGDVDDNGLSKLQEYTNCEGTTRCQCCCRKAGKQIDEGDNNDVYMTNLSYSVLNVVCPVSGMPVIELNDPVRSEECEHIYDRASALNYIANMAKDGFCLCASLGCRALLAKDKLVVDNRLWQDIEELRQIKFAMWENRMLQDIGNIDDSDDD